MSYMPPQGNDQPPQQPPPNPQQQLPVFPPQWPPITSQQRSCMFGTIAVLTILLIGAIMMVLITGTCFGIAFFTR